MAEDDREVYVPSAIVSDYSSTRGDSNSGGDSAEEANGSEGHDGVASHLQEYELDPNKRKEARKMRRVMANRRSARESRERRKKLLVDLQGSVESLTSESVSLTKENLDLRKELAELMQQRGVGLSSLGTVVPNLLKLPPGVGGGIFCGNVAGIGSTAPRATTNNAPLQHTAKYSAASASISQAIDQLGKSTNASKSEGDGHNES